MFCLTLAKHMNPVPDLKTVFIDRPKLLNMVGEKTVLFRGEKLPALPALLLLPRWLRPAARGPRPQPWGGCGGGGVGGRGRGGGGLYWWHPVPGRTVVTAPYTVL